MDVNRFRRDPRSLDEDEESWFDEEEESVAIENTPPPPSIASLPRLTSSFSSSPSAFSSSPRPTLTRNPLQSTQIKLPTISTVSINTLTCVFSLCQSFYVCMSENC